MLVKLTSKNINDPNNTIYLDAAKFLIQKLMVDKNYHNVNRMNVKISLSMKDYGECYLTQHRDGTASVTIRIRSKQSFIQTLLTLAHEMTHAEQLITKRLGLDTNGEWFWNKKNYGLDPYKDKTPDEIYKKLPWEKEAAYNENDLFMEYIAYHLDGNT